MKFLIDKYIPYIAGVLEPFAEVRYASPEEITPEAVRDIDGLIVRTRTRIDRELLGNSKCRFVATATIGMDHFDLPWCMEAGIKAVNAPGCNAPAVAQYVLASIGYLIDKQPDELTLAIVGVGNVGRIVEQWARAIGFNVMLIDPPRQEVEGGEAWSDLHEAARHADIITFHTPLIREGKYPTYHLADSRFFAELKRKPLIINSSRGPVVDNDALLKAIHSHAVSHAVVDVWEGEPSINLELMRAVDISTPHIAGYSFLGKGRAASMVLDAVRQHFNLRLEGFEGKKDPPEKVTLKQVMDSYNPLKDSELMRLKMAENGSEEKRGEVFETLRDTYNHRDEV